MGTKDWQYGKDKNGSRSNRLEKGGERRVLISAKINIHFK